MKIYSSYFYQIRFFSEDMLPISTALFDPQWYHQNKGNNYIYIDKRGVINGVRAECFAPRGVASVACSNCDKDITKCLMKGPYRSQLEEIDFKALWETWERLPEMLHRDISSIVLMFHEKSDNPCSEREIVVEWFRKNGVEVKEWANV